MFGAIVGGAPIWVYVLLAALVALGVRRLKSREVPLFVALIPVAAFSVWSLVGAVSFAQQSGAGIAALAWIGGAVLGALSAFALPDPKATLLPGNRIKLPASWIPLALYLSVFIVRFACGAWAAIVPAQAVMATAIGLAVSAAVTARLVSTALSWRRTSQP